MWICYLCDLLLLLGAVGSQIQQIGLDGLACRILKADFIVVIPMDFVVRIFPNLLLLYTVGI